MVLESFVIVRNVANNTLKASTVESQPRPLNFFKKLCLLQVTVLFL